MAIRGKRVIVEPQKVDDVAKTLKLPNFDYEIFEEITGISKADFDAKLKGVTDER